MGKIKTFVKVIAVIAILAIIAGIFGFILYFTNGGTSEFKTFYLEIDGKSVLEDKSSVKFNYNTDTRFDVKYTFGFLNKEKKGYTVKIIPKVTPESDFDFTVDGRVQAYMGETDITQGFDLKVYDTYFTLHISDNLSMQDILQAVYKDNVVTTPKITMDKDYFTLVISSYNDNIKVSISFHLYSGVIGIEIDKGGITL